MQNYHSHKSFSNIYTPFKDSAAQYDEYCKRAIELGQEVVTSVEHGYCGNWMKCYSTVQKYGLKFVYGAEYYWVKDRNSFTRTYNKKGQEVDVYDGTNAHIVILAKNYEGIKQLNRMMTESNRTGFYKVPRTDIELMKQLNPNDVMVTTACVAFWGKPNKETHDVTWHYSEDNTPEAMENLFLELFNHFGDSIYLEVQAHNTKWQKQINQKCLDLHYKYNVPLIAGLDSHYINESQREERKYLREESGVRMDDEDHEFDLEVYEDYPDEETLIGRFRKQGVLNESEIMESINNTDDILWFDDIVLDKTRKIPVALKYKGLTQEEKDKIYYDIVMDGWERYKPNVPQGRWKEYEQSFMENEVNIVLDTGTSDYFLIDYNLVKRGIEMGGRITPTGRGSCGSWFSNTLLGLSTLDRNSLPVAMYPARFCTAERLKSSLPDVDLNLSNPEIFAKAQEEILGVGHSFPMLAYGTLKYKSAFKLYARAAGLPAQEANDVSKQIDDYEKALKEAEDEDEKEAIDIADFVDSKYIKYIEASAPYRGIIVSKSQAPCAYMIHSGDIESEVGIIRVNADGGKKVVYCTVIDGYTAEEFGFVKNDLLKVQVIGINAETMKRAQLPFYSSHEIIELTKDDKATWDIFSKGYTQGINQCQSVGTTDKLMMYKPKSLQDLSAFVAAIRPGFKSMLNKFLHRESFSYDIPAFDSLLKNDSTGSSWLLYQEDIMKCLSLAGFEMAEAYPIIKAISKKKTEKIAHAKEQFVVGFKKYLIEQQGVDEQSAESSVQAVWQVIIDSASYGFNACVVGDTKMCRHKNDKHILTIGEMYKIRNDKEYANKTGNKNLRRKYLTNGYGVGYSMFDNGKIKSNKIVDIRESGVRDVFRIKTIGNMSIVCTGNHKFPTPDGIKHCDELKVGDSLYRMGQGRKAVVDLLTEIVSIEYVGKEMTYDVEMADPAHNFVLDNSLVTCNSHSVAVALDALYGAYLKAHYPMEYYSTLLDTYSEDGNKDKVAVIKDEMKKAFGIKVVPCKFGQDNRTFFVDKNNNSMSDALTSLKGVGKPVAKALYQMKDNLYGGFIDFLVDAQDVSALKSNVIKTLIYTGYFEQFGSKKKLMKLYDEFTNGSNKVHKNLIDKTIAKRLEILRQMEQDLPEEDISPIEQLSFEAETYGTPITQYPNEKHMYVVLDVNEKYSPKIKMYGAATGNTGIVKVKKADFNLVPMKVGDVINVKTYRKTPAYTYVDGERKVRQGMYDIWVTDYSIMNE